MEGTKTMKLLPLIGLTALLTACGGDGDSSTQLSAQPSGPSAPQPTQMSLSFSDAPVDGVSKVCIAVANISVHPVSGTEQGWSPASFASIDTGNGIKGD